MLLPSVVSSIVNSRESAKIGGNAVVAQWFAHVFFLTMQVADYSGVAEKVVAAAYILRVRNWC
jgi:hypothetical protein